MLMCCKELDTAKLSTTSNFEIISINYSKNLTFVNKKSKNNYQINKN